MSTIALTGVRQAIATVVAASTEVARLQGRIDAKEHSFGGGRDYASLQDELEENADRLKQAAETLRGADASLGATASVLTALAQRVRSASYPLTNATAHQEVATELRATLEPMLAAVNAALAYCQSHER